MLLQEWEFNSTKMQQVFGDACETINIIDMLVKLHIVAPPIAFKMLRIGNPARNLSIFRI